MINCYFTISVFLFLPALNSCINCSPDCFYFSKVLLFIYLIAKIIILAIILSILKTDLSKDWEDNICKNIQELSSFSYIYNIVMLCITGLYFFAFLGSVCCSDYNDYDYEMDYDGI